MNLTSATKCRCFAAVVLRDLPASAEDTLNFPTLGFLALNVDTGINTVKARRFCASENLEEERGDLRKVSGLAVISSMVTAYSVIVAPPSETGGSHTTATVTSFAGISSATEMVGKSAGLVASISITSVSRLIGVEVSTGVEDGNGDGAGAGSISATSVGTSARGISSIACGAKGASGKTIERVLLPERELIVFEAILFELTLSRAVNT